MAILCRCIEHRPRNNRLHIYTHTAEPLGYPSTSSICGIRTCETVGLIFMDDNAVTEYNRGRRIFNYASWVTKVQLKEKAPNKI